MLHALGQPELSRSLFPVGGWPKAVTRDHAARLGLPVATKPDSQEVCFLPNADHTAFVAGRAPELVRDGEVIDPAGQVLARHGGTFRFTIGQRKGTGVSLGERAYVVDIDHTSNRVMIGPETMLGRRALEADRVTWVAGRPPAAVPFEALAQVRYRGEPVPAVVEPAPGGRIRVEFRTPVRAVAPGQSVVIYRGDELLGGGRILRAFR
jgi:tRNA-specific 2-thiouridylase